MDLTLFSEPNTARPEARRDTFPCVGCKAAPKLPGEARCAACTKLDRKRYYETQRAKGRRRSAARWRDKPGECTRCTAPAEFLQELCQEHAATLAEYLADPGMLDVSELEELMYPFNPPIDHEQEV